MVASIFNLPTLIASLESVFLPFGVAFDERGVGANEHPWFVPCSYLFLHHYVRSDLVTGCVYDSWSSVIPKLSLFPPSGDICFPTVDDILVLDWCVDQLKGGNCCEQAQ